MVPPRPRACCRRDVANHDGDYSRPLSAAPARQLRSATSGAGAARSGPLISGPSSISLPGLNMFPTSRVGPSSSVDRNRGAERKADHPRRGFQFPDLRLKSTRRLDDRRPQARNCKFFFQVEPSPCRKPLWSFLPKTCNFCICVQEDQLKAVLKPSDSSTTAAHTLFSSKKPSETGPRTCGGLFLSRKPGRQPGLVPSESGS